LSIFAVTTERGPNWDSERQVREQDAWNEHASFADELVERGVIIAGGPIGGDENEIALLAVEAESESEVRFFFERDPWTVNGVFRIKSVRPWLWWLDGRKSAQSKSEKGKT
jgi:uncharacterized protein YciI